MSQINTQKSDLLEGIQNPIIYKPKEGVEPLHLLSLFSGCGGMDLGFEGQFIAHRKSFAEGSPLVDHQVNDEWVMLKRNRFETVFANDILDEAQVAWTNYMRRFGYEESRFHKTSIVELVKLHNNGTKVFQENIDVVVGGFPCQDFSVAGKRKGFNSDKDDYGKKRESDEPSEETRGKLYFWMKQVIDIVKPKIFVAENVKGLVNLGDVKDIIQKDFASADGNGYIVLSPQVLHAGDFGVPESRERVIFIGIRKDALTEDALKALCAEVISDEYNPYPKPTHGATNKDSNLLPIVTTQDVLSGLKEPDHTEDESQRAFSKAKFMAKGQGQTEIKLDGLGPTIRSEHHGNIEFRRLSAEHGGKHAEELLAGLPERRLTPRECALIQTFPPDYEFVMKGENGKGYRLSASGAYKVIGNAVPPVLAFHIANQLDSVWSKYFG